MCILFFYQRWFNIFVFFELFFFASLKRVARAIDCFGGKRSVHKIEAIANERNEQKNIREKTKTNLKVS